MVSLVNVVSPNLVICTDRFSSPICYYIVNNNNSNDNNNIDDDDDNDDNNK